MSESTSKDVRRLERSHSPGPHAPTAEEIAREEQEARERLAALAWEDQKAKRLLGIS